MRTASSASTDFSTTRIEVDFEHDRVVIIPSTGRRAQKGFLVVPARLRKGGLLLVKGKVGKVPVQVIVDTGAEQTLGNLALRTALLERARYDDEIDVTVLGATTDVSAGTYFRAPKITIGQADLVDLPVTFGDLHVFEIWGLTERLRWSSAWTCWGCSGSSSSTTSAASSSSSRTTCPGSCSIAASRNAAIRGFPPGAEGSESDFQWACAARRSSAAIASISSRLRTSPLQPRHSA